MYLEAVLTKCWWCSISTCFCVFLIYFEQSPLTVIIIIIKFCFVPIDLRLFKCCHLFIHTCECLVLQLFTRCLHDGFTSHLLLLFHFHIHILYRLRLLLRWSYSFLICCACIFNGRCRRLVVINTITISCVLNSLQILLLNRHWFASITLLYF